VAELVNIEEDKREKGTSFHNVYNVYKRKRKSRLGKWVLAVIFSLQRRINYKNIMTRRISRQFRLSSAVDIFLA
jgi:hypothetical protein